jgi:hypothetical protein
VSPDVTAFSGGLVGFFVASSGTRFLPASGHLVHGRPGARFGFIFAHPTLFVTLFDMFGLSFLLIGVSGFISSRHDNLLSSSAMAASVRVKVAERGDPPVSFPISVFVNRLPDRTLSAGSMVGAVVQ